MKSHISWTDSTWNPVTGCDPISEGCRNCYARNMVEHGRLNGHPRYRNGFRVTEHPDKLESLKGVLRKTKQTKVFVGDMCDLFHDEVSDSFLMQIMDEIGKYPDHMFQILTKRANNLNRIHKYPQNVWLGTTIESNRRLDRLDHLLATDAKIKWVSAEPLLEAFKDLSWIKDIDWIVVGGESGPGRRPFNPQWARDIMAACREYGTAFWFKQHGDKENPNDNLLDGQLIQEFPKHETWMVQGELWA